MKVFIAVLIIGCLVASNVYGLDEETEANLVWLYNHTRNCYIILLRLLDDVENSKIETNRAKDKLAEWKEEYLKDTDSVPTQARKMRELMLDMFDIMQEIVRNYRPNNLKTKNLLDEFEEVKDTFMDEMAELKYLLQ